MLRGVRVLERGRLGRVGDLGQEVVVLNLDEPVDILSPHLTARVARVHLFGHCLLARSSTTEVLRLVTILCGSSHETRIDLLLRELWLLHVSLG